MMENEMIAYGLTLVLGVLSGWAGAYYQRTKKALNLLAAILKDDRIDADEVKQIKNFIKGK
jgi:ABC-type uncharacterized transport system permease subunit